MVDFRGGKAPESRLLKGGIRLDIVIENTWQIAESIHCTHGGIHLIIFYAFLLVLLPVYPRRRIVHLPTGG